MEIEQKAEQQDGKNQVQARNTIPGKDREKIPKKQVRKNKSRQRVMREKKTGLQKNGDKTRKNSGQKGPIKPKGPSFIPDDLLEKRWARQ
ncbi:MAG TPA: hypothetical protein VHE12_09255 [bacterium]|nr:hypothetical protein [bacterium]